MVEGVPKHPEEPFVPFSGSLAIAKDLWSRHEQELIDAHTSRVFDEDVNPFTLDAIDHFLKKFPDTVLERFTGHGVVNRQGEEGNLAVLINVLQNGYITGWTSGLANSGWINTYTSQTLFLILSNIDEELVHSDHARKVFGGQGFIKISPGAFVVNNAYYPIVEELRSRFPSANIIKANELPAYIKKELERKP